MNIRTKLKVLSLVTVVGLGLILVTTILGLNAIHEAQDAALRRETYIADLIEIKASALSSIMLDPTLPETKEIFTAAEANVNQHSAIAINMVKRAEIKQEVQKIVEQWNHYFQESQKLIKLAATDPKSANDKLTPLYNNEFKPLLARLEKFIASRHEDVVKAREEDKLVSRNTFWAIISLIALVSILNVFMVLGLSVSLRANLKGIQQQLIPLRQGDLTQRLPATAKDELGEIAAGVNAFVEELQAIVQRTRDRANLLANAALQLASASANTLQSTSQQSDATSSVAASVEQFSVSIDQVADNAAHAEEKATVSGELSRYSSSEVASAVEEIRHIEKIVNEAGQHMDVLGQQAQEISSIVNVITEVADQTNLLALNAAIEAARAGESGRGFAVVADEVRKLAERTSASAQEITSMVATIQRNTQTAASIMQKGNDLVTQGVRQTEQAGSSMQQINDSSRDVIGAVSDISSALREQRIAGAEIAKNVERIAQMTEDGRNTAAEVSSAAKRLEALATELQGEVAKFKT